MKRLIAAATLAIFALPAAAAPVELVCDGTLYWHGEKIGSRSISGIHILVADETVQISGTSLYAATYRIDRQKSDAARIVFDYGLRAGQINRYSGKLGLMIWTDGSKISYNHNISATCGKADPLF